MGYVTSALEDWISQKYIRNNILKSADIDIYQIARSQNIFVHIKPMPARYDIHGRYRAVILDSRTSPKKQREQFFHELCHILRHVGHQSLMPEAFRELQEWDANRFTMYAALPYFMLKKYDYFNPSLIDDLSNDFKVPHNLCIKRMEQIKRNILSNSYIVTRDTGVYN